MNQRIVGVMVMVFVCLLATGCGGSSQSPYKGVLAKIETLRESKLKVLVEKHGDQSHIPESAKEKLVEELTGEANKILAKHPAITRATVDESVADVVTEVKMSGDPTVMPLGFFGWHVWFPIKLLAEAKLPKSRYDNRLAFRVYDAENTLLEEADVDLNADARSGEWVSGYFTIEIQHLEAFSAMKLIQKPRD